MLTTSILTPQKTLYGANVIIFEGIMAFADKELLKVRKGLGSVLGKPVRDEGSSSPFYSLSHSMW